MSSESKLLTSDTLPELELEATRTQQSINWIIKYLRGLAASTGGSAHVIQDEGADMPQRANLDFVGDGVWVLDAPGTDTTRVIIGEGGVGDAGADIRISGRSIQRAGAGVLLFSGSGALLAEYAAITAALAASAVGDLIEPAVGVYNESFTVPAGRTLRGRGWATIIDGQIALGDGAIVQNLDNTHTGDAAGDIVAIVPPASGMAYVIGCRVAGNNATGAGYAAYGDLTTLTFRWCAVSAQSAGVDSQPFGGGDIVTTVIESTPGEGLALNIGVGGAPPAGWGTVSFDDAAWTAPVEETILVGPPPGTSTWIAETDGHRPDNEEWLYRRSFTLGGTVSTATLQIQSDNFLQEVYVNGVLVYSGGSGVVQTIDIADELNAGSNVLAVHTKNDVMNPNPPNPTSMAYSLSMDHESGLGTPYAYACVIAYADGRKAAIPEYGDRASWRTDYASGATHADDWVAGDSHHAPVTLGAGSDAALALAGQELTLADVLTPAEHTALGNSAPHHAPVTLGAGSDAALGLAGQELTLADVLTPAEHTAIGTAAPHHAAVTLGAGSDPALALSGQELTLTLPELGGTKYRQYTYVNNGNGTWSFVTNGDGMPVFANLDTE